MVYPIFLYLLMQLCKNIRHGQTIRNVYEMMTDAVMIRSERGPTERDDQQMPGRLKRRR